MRIELNGGPLDGYQLDVSTNHLEEPLIMSHPELPQTLLRYVATDTVRNTGEVVFRFISGDA